MNRIISILSLLLIIMSGCNGNHADISLINHAVNVTNWNEQRKVIVENAKKQNPEFITLQGLRKAQLVGLEMELNNYISVGEKCKYFSAIETYSPILYKKNEFDLISKSQFNLRDTLVAISDCPGFVTWIKLKSKATGYILFVFNINILADSAVQLTAENFHQLQNKINKITDNAPTIVSGNWMSNDIFDIAGNLSIEKSWFIASINNFIMSDGQSLTSHNLTNTGFVYVNKQFNIIKPRNIPIAILSQSGKVPNTHFVKLDFATSIN